MDGKTFDELIDDYNAARLYNSDNGFTHKQAKTIVGFERQDRLASVERLPNGTFWIDVIDVQDDRTWTGLLLLDGTVDWRAQTHVGRGTDARPTMDEIRLRNNRIEQAVSRLQPSKTNNPELFEVWEFAMTQLGEQFRAIQNAGRS